jgi:hypothetical protein
METEMPKYIAEFHPQAWVDDEAIEIDSPIAQWDVTGKLSEADRAFIDEETANGFVPVLGYAADEQKLLWALEPGNPVHLHARIHPFSIYIRRED